MMRAAGWLIAVPLFLVLGVIWTVVYWGSRIVDVLEGQARRREDLEPFGRWR